MRQALYGFRCLHYNSNYHNFDACYWVTIGHRSKTFSISHFEKVANKIYQIARGRGNRQQQPVVMNGYPALTFNREQGNQEGYEGFTTNKKKDSKKNTFSFTVF